MATTGILGCRLFTQRQVPVDANKLSMNGVRYLICRVIEVTVTTDVCTVSGFSHHTETVHFF